MSSADRSAAKPLCGANWPTPCEDCVGSCGIEEYIEEQEARSAASPSPREFSIAVKRLHGIHEWVTSGIAETLDKPGGAFLLGVESEAIIDALDYIEGYIYNLEDELGR